MAKVQDLIDFGIPRACFCRTDLNLIASDEGLIYTGLSNGCNQRIIKLFIDYFGNKKVLNAIEQRKDKININLYNAIKREIDAYN